MCASRVPQPGSPDRPRPIQRLDAGRLCRQRETPSRARTLVLLGAWGWCSGNYALGRRADSKPPTWAHDQAPGASAQFRARPAGGQMSKACSIAGCEKPSRTRGWCENHYSQWRRCGSPLGKSAIAPAYSLRRPSPRCSACGRKGPLETFEADPRYVSGYRSRCRDCRNARVREVRGSKAAFWKRYHHNWKERHRNALRESGRSRSRQLRAATLTDALVDILQESPDPIELRMLRWLASDALRRKTKIREGWLNRVLRGNQRFKETGHGWSLGAASVSPRAPHDG